MRIVTCYDCGKRYNYDEDGFCPSCGAFNQPPSASRIGPDGSVIRMEGINRQNHEGSFVHKEYHGENRKRKGTALEQAETERNPIRRSMERSVIRQPLAQRDGTPTQMFTQKKGKKKGISPIFWGAILLFLLNMMSRM